MNSEEKSILVIDDDVTVRKLISFHLKKKNYTVFEADGSEKGMEQLTNQNIDLVLCDVNMEGMDGFTFCKKVREQEKYRVLPFIFVTAKSALEDKEKALEVGGDDIITKPFDVQELILKVQALIRRSEIYKVYGAKKQLEQSVSETIPKILLVDDDISLSKLFQYNLNKSGFETHVANDATEGLELAKKVQPDIIISDVMMPEIDGFEFRRMLMKDPELKDVPFIFLTAKSGEEDILEGYDLGINDYVLKTAGPRVVVAKVSAIIKSLGSERQRVVSELHKAADSLRVKVVPDSAPSFNGFLIQQWHVPFKGIPGGDFIDYFPLGNDSLAIILGDVMGKKWGAWYFAVAYAGYVRSSIRSALQSSSDYSPKDILQQVNSAVYQDAKISEVFATLSVVILNNKSKVIKYSGAGDLPLVFKQPNGGTRFIQSKGLLLGFSSDGNFEDIEIRMDPGSIIALVTDGITESKDASGKMITSEGFASILDQMPENNDPLSHIQKVVSEKTRNKFEDDISLILIKSL